MQGLDTLYANHALSYSTNPDYRLLIALDKMQYATDATEYPYIVAEFLDTVIITVMTGYLEIEDIDATMDMCYINFNPVVDDVTCVISEYCNDPDIHAELHATLVNQFTPRDLELCVIYLGALLTMPDLLKPILHAAVSHYITATIGELTSTALWKSGFVFVDSVSVKYEDSRSYYLEVNLKRSPHVRYKA